MISRGLRRDVQEILRLLSHILSTGDKAAISCMLPWYMLHCRLGGFCAHATDMMPLQWSFIRASMCIRHEIHYSYWTFLWIGVKADACDQHPLDRKGLY